MKISECAGARVHTALTPERKITWCVHYKNESVWCNSREELTNVLLQISQVQLFGEQFKTWKVGENGWRKNTQE
jgi:hypothetical protein